MSEFLSAAASSMNVPETLVKRSAEARSKAAGASVEEVLAAWAGGGPAPSAPAPAIPDPAASSEPESVPEPASASVLAAPASVPSPQPVPAAVAVLDEPEEDPVEAVGFRERARVGGRIGMGFGVFAAILVMLFSAQWLLARSGSIETEAGDITFTFSLVAGSLLVGSALIGLVVGAAGAAFVRAVTGWRNDGMQLVSSHASTIGIGAVAGLVTGVVVAVVVSGSGSPDTLDETITVVPLLPAVLWTLFGWVGGGWLIGALTHAVGVPQGLEESEVESGTTVRQRLTAAFSLPVVSALAIALVVLPAAWVFIQFPAWAPLIAIFIAGGIIAFAGMAAARPGMRISAGEFLVAAAGVGVVVIILVAVLTTQGAAH